MSLIERCLCGATHFDVVTRNSLPIAVCDCGVQHLVSALSPEQYEAQYRGEYHAAQDRHPGCVPYRQRYEHDKRVAKIRWHRYGQIFGEGLWPVGRTLDVGAANGAFVDFLTEIGVEAYGIDPDPAMARGTIGNCKAADLTGPFHLVTYHDVLEHTLDPRAEISQALRLCTPGGRLVVDVPDVSVAAGHHHYKAEHPWYFTADALRALLVGSGFAFLQFDLPLPGKLVAYARAP